MWPVFLGLWWSMVVFTAVRGESSEAKSALQFIKFKYPQLYPERFAWDASHQRFILGSTILGKLVALNEAGQVEDFISDEDFAGKSQIHGVFVDTSRNRVLAVMEARQGDSDPSAALVAYDLDSKERTLIVTLSEDGRDAKDLFFFKDVCVDHQGNAYVTESLGSSIWKVTASGEKSLFAVIPQVEPMVKDEPRISNIGVNGIAYADGLLLVNQFGSGALFRVKVSQRKVDRVKIGNGFFLLSEADGMTLRQDGTLVVLSAHSAWLLSSRDSWRSASLLDTLALNASTFSTGVVAKKSRVYIIASDPEEKTVDLGRESFQVEEIDFPYDSANDPLYLLAILGIFGVVVLIWKFQLNQFSKNYTKKRL